MIKLVFKDSLSEPQPHLTPKKQLKIRTSKLPTDFFLPKTATKLYSSIALPK